MNTLLTRLVGNRRRLVVCFLLICASVACGGMVFLRFLATDRFGYLFLVWNLFLAWVPFGASLLAYELHRRNERGLLLIGVGLFWLLFFPNAPYIVSDLVHLGTHGVTPDRFIFWFDLVMISCFSWTGLLLGFVSLYLMQLIIRATSKEKIAGPVSWGFVGVVMALGGFGVYLGRFERWNSWDVLHKPVDLVSAIVAQVMHPFSYPQTWGITILFAAMMTLLYVLLYGVVMLAQGGKGGTEKSWKGEHRLATSLD